jgi:hypothetical protein
MGVDISTWRARIGSQGGRCRCVAKVTLVRQTVNWFFLFLVACVLVLHVVVSNAVLSFNRCVRFVSDPLNACALLGLVAVVDTLLTIGCIELNPGPACNDVVDIHGKQYCMKRITGDGACCYRALSYSFCGSESRYPDIVSNCLSVFANRTDLFQQHTDFSRSQGNLEQYAAFMNGCLDDLRAGRGLDPQHASKFWGEDAHLMAMSLLYDIRVYVFLGYQPFMEWHAYNIDGRRGYVCLYKTHDHVNVLLGASQTEVPDLPTGVRLDYLFPSRRQFHWDDAFDTTLQDSSFNFVNVWPLPRDGGTQMATSSSVQSAGSSHEQHVHSGSDHTLDTSLVCPICNNNKPFASAKSLKTHMSKFHRVCSTTLDNDTSLTCSIVESSQEQQVHSGSDHTLHTSLVCVICNNDKPFASVKSLKKHMSKFHPGCSTTLDNNTSFTCTICNNGRKFNNNKSLNDHLTKFHRGSHNTTPDSCSEHMHTTTTPAVDVPQPPSYESLFPPASNDTPSGNMTVLETSETSNNNCTRSTRSRSRTSSTESEGTFADRLMQFSSSTPQQQAVVTSDQRSICPNCGKRFANLANHKKCNPKRRSASVESDVTFVNRMLRSDSVSDRESSDGCNTDSDSDVSMNQTVNRVLRSGRLSHCSSMSVSDGSASDVGCNSSTSESVNLNSVNTSTPVKSKTQCPYCKNWFVNILNHKVCKKRPVHQPQSDTLSESHDNIQAPLQNTGNSHYVVNPTADSDHSVIASSSDDDSIAMPPPRNSRRNRIYHSKTGKKSNAGTVTTKSNSSRSAPRDYGQDPATRHDHYQAQLQKDLEAIRTKYPRPAAVDDTPEVAKLAAYFQTLTGEIDNITTLRCSEEVRELLVDPETIGDEKRPEVDDPVISQRIAQLALQANQMGSPAQWTWNATPNTPQWQYNDDRLRYWLEHETKFKILKSCANPKCQCSDILMGKECASTVCRDCMTMASSKGKLRDEVEGAWQNIKPRSGKFPSRVDAGHVGEDLPDITLAERSVIAPVQPVVTVTKNFMAHNKMRQETITLTQDPDNTWACMLPRTNLKESYVLIERTDRNKGKKYLVADSAKVSLWLQRLFSEHEGIVQMQADGKLKLSEQALHELEAQGELAEVDELCDSGPELQRRAARDVDRDGLANASMQPAMTSHHVFSLVKNIAGLYTKVKDALKLKKDGRLQVVSDSAVRTPAYNVSPTMAFPHLYCEKGQKSPVDHPKPHLAEVLMRKQMLYAHQTALGKRRWWNAEDGIHMMHQYSNLQERQVNRAVGFVLNQHPEVAHIPVDQLIDTLKQGADDQGLIDSRIPNVHLAMSELSNSREMWYGERLGIEAMSRDCGRPNLFSTYNTDCRNWFRVRRLLYELETESNPEFGSPSFESWLPNTDQWTKLVDKHAALLSDYVQRYFKTFFDAFYGDVCGVSKVNACPDYTAVKDRTSPDLSWFWYRVEWTETRGLPHWHCLIKLPHVLDTALLGRVSQNGRLVRNEMLCGNIKPECVDAAWQTIELGFLAERYAILYTDSVQRCAFYEEPMAPDQHDSRKVINLTKLTDDFVEHYKRGDINYKTHPIMRTPLMADQCCETREQEVAHIASVSQVHQCLPNSCGGDPATGKGCRFDFPKRCMNKTAVGMVQVNSEQFEARVISKRTDERVNNVNPLALYWWRANSDHTALIDAAHSMRYCTKYASKSSKHSQIYLELLEHLRARGLANLPNNVRHVLVQVFLASCAHRSFMSKMEVAYKVMRLPLVAKSFPDVEVDGCYWRATLLQSRFEPGVTVYNDRTKYAAYAERLNKTNVLKNLTFTSLQSMCYRDFCELVQTRFQRKRSLPNTQLAPKGRRGQLRACVQGSGHWVMSRRPVRAHVRFSTVLNTDHAIGYVPVDPPTEHSPKTFFEMPVDQRRQLSRSYYELVNYVPWQGSPDETFLSQSVRDDLDKNDDERACRYSMKRCERYNEVYRTKYEAGLVAPAASQWHYDNQASYTMFLVNGHNSEIKTVRSGNEGRYNVLFEPAQELVGVDIDIRPALYEEADDYDYPSADNYLLADHFSEIMKQPAPVATEVAVAFPTNCGWQAVDDQMRENKSKRFMAAPPPPSVPFHRLTPLQQSFVELAVTGEDQVLYLLGKAGSGKSEVLKHICQRMGSGKVQIGATTGKAASYFHGPTVHGMFGLSHLDFTEARAHLDPSDTKCKDNRIAYEGVELFIIDEASMLPSHMLGFLEEVMTTSFNPDRRKRAGLIPPFGGRRVIFVGDMAQLPPVEGEAFYAQPKAVGRRAPSALRQSRALRGHDLYVKLLHPNVTILQRSYRNSGLLARIADNIRAGQQTPQDQKMLELQYRRHYPCEVDRGIHYANEAAMTSNWRTLWAACKSSGRRLWIARASYHETPSNRLVVDMLSSLPSKTYSYAPHLLCLAVGCEVRLVKNLDVSAGLVNSAAGTVVSVVYDAADAKHLLAGKHPPPYAVIVDFPDFTGFKGDQVAYVHPFANHPTWVPITRQKFLASHGDLPSSVRAQQQTKDCWRLQFPLDLATHVTAHRAQGATLGNCRVLVDLGLDNPANRPPNDAAAILYVAITRATHLKYLFVKPIAPTIWEKLGRSEDDQARREEEDLLRDKAREFASGSGRLDLVEDEFAWAPDHSGDAAEHDELHSAALPPSQAPPSINAFADPDFEANVNGETFAYVHKPVGSERHIGIDQGTRNFAIVAVDRIADQPPTLVAATLYRDLDLPARFKAHHVVTALQEEGELLSLMQLPGHPAAAASPVDRVVVHVEQMCVKNANAKTFGIDFATTLQRLAPDLDSCVVRLSHPNLHHAGGPAFCLGDQIVQDLALRPVSTVSSEFTAAGSKRAANGQAVSTYDLRKEMSAKVFKYIIEADGAALQRMNIGVADHVRDFYRELLTRDPTFRLHDLGDALMHALRGVLCGSSTFRNVVPKDLTLYNNRTVCINVFPLEVFWVSTLVSWNGFLVEGMGSYKWRGLDTNARFLDHAYAQKIASSISLNQDSASRPLAVALRRFDGDDLYARVDHIKVVVKQQTTFHERYLCTRREAGAFTNATVAAMQLVCDKVMDKSKSDKLTRKDKKTGWVYMRTRRDDGTKYQITRSTGKHTNAVMCCLAWFRENLKDFVEQRRLILKEWEKGAFFQALRKAAKAGESRLELIEFSDVVRDFLASKDDAVRFSKNHRNLADCVLISLSKNQQHVKSVASNYRKPRNQQRTQQEPEDDEDQQPPARRRRVQ